MNSQTLVFIVPLSPTIPTDLLPAKRMSASQCRPAPGAKFIQFLLTIKFLTITTNLISKLLVAHATICATFTQSLSLLGVFSCNRFRFPFFTLGRNATNQSRHATLAKKTSFAITRNECVFSNVTWTLGSAVPVQSKTIIDDVDCKVDLKFAATVVYIVVLLPFLFAHIVSDQPTNNMILAVNTTI